MATVRFSDDLISRVTKTARNMFRDRITIAETGHPDWGNDIYDLMFESTVEQMNNMPDGYFHTDNEITLSGFKGAGWDSDINLRLELRLHGYRRFPANISAELHGLSKDGMRMGGYTLNSEDDRWGRIEAEYKTYCLLVVAVKNEAKVFVQGVRQVMGTFPTLSPALKAWPALWDLIPEDVRERHREVKPRNIAKKQAAAVLNASVDLNALTGSVAAKKFTR